MDSVSDHNSSAEAHLRWIILKVHQHCNLNCSYCYVYHRGDSSWKSRPKQISDRVLDQVGFRIREHCEKHGLQSFVVELHGGEPLLVGKKRLGELVERLRGATPGIALTFLLQTNGTLLDQEWCELFLKHRIFVGVSLDGPAEFADRHRYFHNGRGSTAHILKRLNAIRESEIKSQFGYLSVINPVIDGGRMIDWFVENSIESADLLLPLGNAANLPASWSGPAPYTRFLIAAFERWLALDDVAPEIRLFETIIRALLGTRPRLDALGGDLRSLCAIETNGAICVSDVIRICGGDFSLDKLDVFDARFDEIAGRLNVAAVQEPSAACKQCAAFSACGGGYLPHRYNGHDFQNPSLYCETLYALTARAQSALLDAIPASMVKWR